MTEKDFEEILATYPALIEEGLKLVGRQVPLGRLHMDLLFEDRHSQQLIVELKKGTIMRNHISQLMDYEGHLLTADDPNIRIMLIGNRVPDNFRKSLDYHGIEWREITYASLTKALTDYGNTELLSRIQAGEGLSSEVVVRPRGTTVTEPAPERSRQPTSSVSLLEMKRRLAEKHIKDPVQKKIFLERATAFKTWANYIAGLVLTNSGRPEFRAVDIRDTLRVLMPDHIDREGAKENGILTADVELNQTKYNLGLPCLERVSGSNHYRFIGFCERK